jgi:hypothetical protein
MKRRIVEAKTQVLREKKNPNQKPFSLYDESTLSRSFFYTDSISSFKDRLNAVVLILRYFFIFLRKNRKVYFVSDYKNHRELT